MAGKILWAGFNKGKTILGKTIKNECWRNCVALIVLLQQKLINPFCMRLGAIVALCAFSVSLVNKNQRRFLENEINLWELRG